MLPKMNEIYADFVLSVSKGGLYDMVTDLKIDEDKGVVIANLQPSLIEKFAYKFPDVNLIELDNAVNWILLK
ncbi:MAG: hypothetical protein DRI37_09050, partial [Chloroflexi bacterium]